MCARVVRAQGHLLLAAATALSLLPAGVHAATAPARPEVPRTYVDTAYVPPSGRRIAVRAGGDLQAALNAAQAGDVITLQAGATFAGPFTLPDKPGDGWITIRTSAPDSSLPAPGTRIDPSYARAMPVLTAGTGSVITTAPGAHHYRFTGIEIRPREGVFLYNLVLLGSNERAVDRLPHHIIFDRCYLHGDPRAGARRGIAMNSRYTAVIDSYLSDFKEAGADSQAIMSWNGTGPFKITNDYLEAAGENVMFGGADPTIPNLVPSDIEIRGNDFAKPLSWRAGAPAHAGAAWTVKNLFELKNAQRVLVDGNTFEYNWVGADQAGFAIVLTPRNQDGAAPWTIVQDVTFTHNVVRHAPAGVNMLGRDDIRPSQQLQRVLIQHNLFADLGGAAWGFGRLFQFVNGTADVVIDHNTAFQSGEVIAATGPPNAGFVFTNNIAPANRYGVGGDGTFGNPRLTLSRYFPGAVFERNVLVGASPSSYPPGNFFPASLADVGFAGLVSGDYALAASSPYRDAGTGGTSVGADIAALPSAISSSSHPKR